MKITRLRTKVVRITMDPPVGLGTAALRFSGCVLVFLECDQGVVGEGLVFTFNDHRLAELDAMVRTFEPLVVGLDPHMSGVFLARAAADLRNFGTSGMGVMAQSGVEGALLDLRAKLLDVNIAYLLGAHRTTMPVYQSSELWVTKSIDELQRAAADEVKRGFRAMKLRLTGEIESDVARVHAVREAIGPEIGLMADANQKMTVATAIRFGRVIERYNLVWFEEPILAHDHMGEATIAAALDTPLASGETVFGPAAMHEMLRLRSADVLMPDLIEIGGPSAFMKVAELADAHHVPISNHTYSEMSISLLAAIPNASWLEYMPWISPIYREQIELNEQGHAVLPNRPGWGFSFDPAAIERYAAN